MHTLKEWLKRLSIAKKLWLIGFTASVPFVAITCYLVTSSVNKDIRFGQWEQFGNAYQRPLETLLAAIPEHAVLTAQRPANDPALRATIAGKQSEIELGFNALAAVQQQLGDKLEFTEAGLAQRKREHVRLATVRQEWEELKGGWENLAPAIVEQRHAHLVADIRTMLTHAGDTSNLILDPDLDSYYLMDITLVSLPQTQDRLATIAAYGAQAFGKPALSATDRTQLAVYAALLRDADFDRIQSDAQTALSEDHNFNGISETLQARLPAAIQEYSASTGALLALLEQSVGPEQKSPPREAFLATANQARAASFKLWQTGADELDALLEKRVAHYQYERARSRLLTGLALVFCAVLVSLITASITRPLRRISGLLRSEAQGIRLAAGQISDSGKILADRASDQAAALEESSASLEELTSTVRRNAEGSHRAKGLSTEARAAADSAASDMRQMLQTMESIRLSSGEVTKIVKVIDEIAFQTNILALNAAVEAARAGEAGAGFAVVADEVRNLAQRSAQAARETSEKIESAVTNSQQGVQVCGKVAGSLEQIIAKARNVDDLLGEIATASKEQAQGIQQVNLAVTQMDQVTQANAATAEESARASEQLNAQAEAQKQVVADLQELVEGVAGGKAPADSPGATAARAAAPVRPTATASEHGRQRQITPRPVSVASAHRSAGLPMPQEENFQDF